MVSHLVKFLTILSFNIFCIRCQKCSFHSFTHTCISLPLLKLSFSAAIIFSPLPKSKIFTQQCQGFFSRISVFSFGLYFLLFSFIFSSTILSDDCSFVCLKSVNRFLQLSFFFLKVILCLGLSFHLLKFCFSSWENSFGSLIRVCIES